MRLVLDLQKDAIDSTITVENLLRKALIVSTKLKRPEIEDWLNSELNGYENITNIPDYRKVLGIMKAFNPYQGWVPVFFESEEMKIAASTQINVQSIGEITVLSKSEKLTADISFDLKKKLNEENGVMLEIKVFFSPTSMVKILESVRNIILNWALDLEKIGILGDEMNFTEDEILKAKASHIIVNNIGSMNNSQLQQLTNDSNQELSIENIDNILEKAKELANSETMTNDLKNEILCEVSTIETQNRSPKPKKAIIIESLKSLRNIAEGMTGSVIATGLLTLLQQFF